MHKIRHTAAHTVKFKMHLKKHNHVDKNSREKYAEI